MQQQSNTKVEIQSQHAKSNLVQMAETVAQGKLPTDTQVTHELGNAASFLQEREKASNTRDAEKIYHDTRKFVESITDVVEQGSFGERLNRFVSDVTQLAEMTPTTNDPKEAWIETRDFLVSLRDLIVDLAKSPSYRKSIVQLVKIMKDVVYDETRSKPTKALEKDFIENKSAKETAKDVANETINAVKELPKVEDLPEDKKRQIRDQFKAMMKELNEHSETSYAFRKLMKLWSRLSCELTFQLSREEVDPNIRRVELEAKQIIEILSGRSLDVLLAKLREVIRIIENDQELQGFLTEIRNYIQEGLEKPEIAQTEAFYDKVEDFIVRGRKLANKYQQDWIWNDFVDAASDVFTGLQANEQFSNVQYRAGKLAADFVTTDVTGKKSLDTDLLGQLRADLLPFLMERIRQVPIPGFQIQNESFEYLIVDDLFVEIDDIVPDKIKIHSRNDTDVTLKNFENPVKSESIVKVKIEGVRPKFNNFYFKFKRNSAIGIQDEGRANLSVLGSGVNIYMEFNIDVNTENKGFLGEARVDVSVDKIDLDIIEANHKTLLNIVSPLFTTRVKNELEGSLKLRIKQLAGEWSAIVNKRLIPVLPGVLPKGPMDGFATKLVDTLIE